MCAAEKAVWHWPVKGAATPVSGDHIDWHCPGGVSKATHYS